MISSLTEEQGRKLVVYRDKWLAIGRATGSANRPLAEKYLTEAYAAAGIPAPGRFEWADSPRAGLEVASKLSGKPQSSLVSSPCYGQHDAGWLSFYDFMGAELGIAAAERLRPLMNAATECGWFWCFSGACVITERPDVCLVDSRGRLDCRTGPAIKYRDGYSVYAVGGVRVPAYVVEERDSLTHARVAAIDNLEQRRVAIELMGLKRYVATGNFSVVDSDTDSAGNARELLSSPDAGGMLLLRVVNSSQDSDGTSREYFIRVDTDCRPILSPTERGEPQSITCSNAAASLAGYSADKLTFIKET